MDLRTIMLSEISQMEKSKNYDFTLLWDIKQKATAEQIKQTYRQRQQYGGYQSGRGVQGKMKRVKGDQTYDDGRRLAFGGEHTVEYTDDV